MSEKQMDIPGTQPPRIPEIEKAAEDYARKRDARMAAGKVEVEAKKKLIDLLKAHKVSSYPYNVEVEGEDGGKEELRRVAELKVTEKVRVGTPESEEADDEPEE